MDISLFDYQYPEELVAQHPLAERDASRLMVLDPARQSWTHQGFKNFADYFGPEDIVVMNDVRVWPSRLYGTTDRDRRVEVLLLDRRSDHEWTCLVRPASKIKSETRVRFSEQLSGMLSGQADAWQVRFEASGDLQELIAAVGFPPLPPYIKRDDASAAKQEDILRYQTVYANELGAAAAPTAGFHLTDAVLADLKERGVELAFVTLNVGRDTFQPVRSENIVDHKMHGEHFHISEETMTKITAAKREGRRVTAIGTTTVRVLESAEDAGRGFTNKFIYPGYKFQRVDRLLTNFHQPKSTLVMLVSAFAGREFLLSAYQEAVREQYRLFSFGDAMLILNRI